MYYVHKLLLALHLQITAATPTLLLEASSLTFRLFMFGSLNRTPITSANAVIASSRNLPHKINIDRRLAAFQLSQNQFCDSLALLAKSLASTVNVHTFSSYKFDKDRK